MVLQVLFSAEGIDQLARGRFDGHCVDREVATGEIDFNRQSAIVVDVKLAMAKAGRHLIAGKGDIELHLRILPMPELEDSKTFTYGEHLAVFPEQTLDVG